jgi:hypothetical protein
MVAKTSRIYADTASGDLQRAPNHQINGKADFFVDADLVVRGLAISV